MTTPAYCPTCGIQRPPGAAFCGACGTRFEAEPPGGWTQPPPPQQPATPPNWVVPPPPRGSGIIRKLVIGAVVVVVALVVLGSFVRERTGTLPDVPRATVVWPVPAGFTKFDDSMAYRWVDTGSCDLSERCWIVEVVTREGCPGGLYIELDTLTSEGTVVGYTNDTLASIRAGETGRMVFDNLDADQGATQARIADVSCHS